jgi:hypothetical protein
VSKCLVTLPSSIGSLKHLHKLDLSFLKELKTLPASFGALEKLHNCRLSSCAGAQGLESGRTNSRRATQHPPRPGLPLGIVSRR